ncbi:winged helix-turn-helix domain-containing protein [Bradyrhizobium sp. BEA-2-5]|uniref:winged helix-turn-helix domain-containing tetratricopeptide repeat protein n=1 Tax=Bradyrhizobium TaxID=374 RepID=UPI000A7E3394|nr:MULTISPECIES: winged helix-turn-helix domain-containing protein [Bradyrhizobium]WOH84667.1 winged helix-turn-helix domain-containing protein [Bradyrhizobium sp. BEA-2-5]
MLKSSQPSIVIGDRTLDLAREFLLDGRGDIVPLRPQAWAVLRLLAQRVGRLVHKDEILDEVWSDCEVTEDSLVQAIGDIREALGGAGRLALRTLPRRGYMLVVDGEQADRPASASVTTSSMPDHAGKPAGSSSIPHLSIVVLPFTNIGGDLEQEYFVDGVTHSLTTDLSRIAGAFVIGRGTAFTFKGKAVDVREIGRELNVRYALEGSVQRGGNRFRLNVQLTDTETGAHVWAERFDKPAADLLDMQDEIVSRLANTLNAELIKAEARRAERLPQPDAMDLYFQGRAVLNKGIAPAVMARARDFFMRALALDPDNIEAAVAAAHVDFAIGSSSMADDGPAYFRAAENALNGVLLRAPNHPRAHMLLGAVQIRTHRAAKGIAECRQALALDRNLADAYGFIGLGKHALGRGEEVEGHIQEALRLSPRDTRAFLWIMVVGMAKLMSCTNADLEALDWLRRSIEANPNFALAHFHLAGALAMMGDLEEAQSSAKAGLALDPNFSIRRYDVNVVFLSDNPVWLAKRKRFYEGMRMAGVPES